MGQQRWQGLGNGYVLLLDQSSPSPQLGAWLNLCIFMAFLWTYTALGICLKLGQMMCDALVPMNLVHPQAAWIQVSVLIPRVGCLLFMS